MAAISETWTNDRLKICKIDSEDKNYHTPDSEMTFLPADKAIDSR